MYKILTDVTEDGVKGENRTKYTAIVANGGISLDIPPT